MPPRKPTEFELQKAWDVGRWMYAQAMGREECPYNYGERLLWDQWAAGYKYAEDSAQKGLSAYR